MVLNNIWNNVLQQILRGKVCVCWCLERHFRQFLTAFLQTLHVQNIDI